jgi:indole-3-glycerol phosphate synthase
VNRLDPILAATRTEVARRRELVPEAELERVGAQRLGDGDLREFAAALSRPGPSLIAEHKRRSPSAGAIREELSLSDVVRSYERAGAAALSVLTEGPSFGGSLDDLREARTTAQLPLLRKDFIVEPYQVFESLAAGADAILLIVAALGEAQLGELLALARELGLAALVEVHDEGELEVAGAAGAEIIGINNRDLTTLEVDTERTYELLPRIPEAAVVVAESGFSRPEEVARLWKAGVDAVLVGEALMRAEKIEDACRALLGGAV